MIENGIWEKYEKKELIGSGSYGNVYKALNKDTGNYVAIKEIKGFGSFSLFCEIKIFLDLNLLFLILLLHLNINNLHFVNLLEL